MDVTLPDGTVVNGVPDGMTKDQLVQKLAANGHDVSWYSPSAQESSTKNIPQVARKDQSVDDILSGYANLPFLQRAGAASADLLGGAAEFVGGGAAAIPGMVESGARGLYGKMGKGLSGDALAQFKQDGITKGLTDLTTPETATGKALFGLVDKGFGTAKDVVANAAASAINPIGKSDEELRALQKTGQMPQATPAIHEYTDPILEGTLGILGAKHLASGVVDTIKGAKTPSAPTIDLLKEAQEIMDRKKAEEMPPAFQPQYEGLPKNNEPMAMPRTKAEQAADVSRLTDATADIDSQEPISPYKVQETPPELEQLNQAPVRDPSTGRPMDSQMYVPKGQRGMLDVAGIADEIKKLIDFGFTKDEAKSMLAEDQEKAQFTQNGSGESSASVEAINRIRDEQEKGQTRYLVKSDDSVTKITDVDQKAQPGEVIVQKGIGKDPFTVLDNNKGNSFRAIAMIKKQGGAFTPFAKKEASPIKDYSSLESFAASLPESVRAAAPELWAKYGGSITSKDVTSTVADSKLAQYLAPMMKNKSDVYTDNSNVLRASPDIESNGFRDNTMAEGASAKRFLNNPVTTYAINVINGGRMRAKIASDNAIKQIQTSIGSITGFFGGNKELHDAMASIALGEDAKTAKGQALVEQWHKMADDLYEPLNEAWRKKQENAGIAPENIKDLKKLSNYFPHTWEGPYGFKIVDSSGKTISFVRQKTRQLAEAALQHYNNALKTSDLSATKVEYNELYDRTKFQQDIGMVNESFLEMLDVLGKDDPIIQAKRDSLNTSLEREAWKTRNVKQRFMKRVGVEGYSGNQPWKTEAQNAHDTADVMTNYIRDANTFIEAQKVNEQVKALSDDLSDSHPNAVQYALEYQQKTFGHLGNMVGDLENVILKGLTKPFGRSPASLRDFANATKGIITGLALTARPTFMLANILQAPKAFLPELLRMAAKDNKISIGQASVAGIVQGVLYPAMKAFPSLQKAVLSKDALATMEYIKEHHIVDIGVMDNVFQLDPGPLRKIRDTALNATTRYTEQVARVWNFTAFVKAFKDTGYSLEKSHQMAEDMNSLMMGDYNRWNQPRVYQRLGLLGQSMSNLATYKHNMYTQLVYDIKRAKNQGEIAPLVAKLGLTFAVAGVVGLTGFKDLDALWALLHKGIYAGSKTMDMVPSKGFIEARSPSQWMNEETPIWMNIGPLSAAMGANVSASFSDPAMTPDSPTTALYPLAGLAYNVAEGAGQVAKGVATGDNMKMAEGANRIVPEVPLLKSTIENKFLSSEGPNGSHNVEQPNQNYATVFNRNPKQQAYKKWGFTENNESLDKTLNYQLKQQEEQITQAKTDTLRKIPEVMASYRINTKYNPEFKNKLGDLAQSFIKLGGDPSEFIKAAEAAGMKRADVDIVTQAISKHLSSVKDLQKADRRMQAFQKSRENR